MDKKMENIEIILIEELTSILHLAKECKKEILQSIPYSKSSNANWKIDNLIMRIELIKDVEGNYLLNKYR